MADAKILVPTGMLGGGFSARSIDRGIELGAHAIAVDGGSTDSGPAYLGRSMPKMPAEAIAADLRVLLTRAIPVGIPVIVGSAGTSGTDSGVDWVAGIVETIAAEEGLTVRIARIYSELDVATIHRLHDEGRVDPLAPLGPITHDLIDRCEHIVGVLGAEPFIAALDAGATVIVAGRATDTAVIAAAALRRGCPPGPSWHGAKMAECGGQCTSNPRGGGVLVDIDDNGFTVEPLELTSTATPLSVAAHMIYENANPNTMREPSGTLDVSQAMYEALDDRRVRVTGSTIHARAVHEQARRRPGSSATRAWRSPGSVTPRCSPGSTCGRSRCVTTSSSRRRPCSARRGRLHDRDPLLRVERGARRPRSRPDTSRARWGRCCW